MAGDLGKAQAKLNQFSRSVEGRVGGASAASFGALGAAARGATALLTPLGIGLASVGFVAVKAVKSFASFEQAETAFTVMLGSAEKAKDFLADLQQFAARTPFSFTDLTAGTQRLIAMGFSAERAREMLEPLGNLASAMPDGASAGLERITRAIGQMHSKGKVSAQEMSLQLGEAGIPAAQALADHMGMSVAEVQKQIELGKISAEDGVAAILKLGSSAKFGGMMEKQSATLGGVWSTLKDSAEIALVGIGQALADGFDLKGMVTGLSSFVSSVTPILKPILSFAAQFLSISLKWFSPIGLLIQGIRALVPVFNLLWAAAQPLRDWLVPAWDAAKGAASGFMTMLGQMWESIKKVALEVWTQVKTFLTSVFTLASRMLGLDKVGSALTSFRNEVIDALITVEFGFLNWKRVGELVFLNVQLGVTTFGETVRHVFTAVIPAYLDWLGANWKNVFQDMANIAGIMMQTVLDNLSQFGKLLPRILMGDAAAAAAAAGILAGGIVLNFEAKTKPLPVIAGRQMTAAEKELMAKRDGLADALGIDLAAFMAKRRAEIFGPKAAEQGTFWADLLKGFKGTGTGPNVATISEKLAAGMELGSREAVSLINNARSRGGRGVDPAREAVRIAKQQLDEEKKANAHLRKLIDKQAAPPKVVNF